MHLSWALRPDDSAGAVDVPCDPVLIVGWSMHASDLHAESAPWAFFAPHDGKPFAFFVDRGAGLRASFAGSRPCGQLVVDADATVRAWTDGCWQREHGDPLERIQAFVERSRHEAVAVPAWLDGEVLPRTVGYLAYELGPWADGPPSRAESDRDGHVGPHRMQAGTPLAVLSTYDEIDAWDPASGDSVRVRLAPPSRPAAAPAAMAAVTAEWRSTSYARWRRGFECIQQAIGAGDIYQANLSRRAVFGFDGDAAAAYARLRDVQPVPFGAFLDFGGFALLSNSPELFLARDGERVVTRPIKGTRARSTDPRGDAAVATELRSDPKEMAEHLMIVDLERNDLGRVARTGSVAVPRLAGVESFATVHHLVSDVHAALRPDTGLAALLRATFPGGSITGAPKLRAMQILSEVERDERGPYTGAIGFFDGGEHFELSIAIRTALTSGARMLYSTGGGIVADSQVALEWKETELKVAALREALALREADLLSTREVARTCRATAPR